MEHFKNNAHNLKFFQLRWDDSILDSSLPSILKVEVLTC